MSRTPRPTHCARCDGKLKRAEIPPADERGPDTWCWSCCKDEDDNPGPGMSTYAVAATAYSSPYQG